MSGTSEAGGRFSTDIPRGLARDILGGRASVRAECQCRPRGAETRPPRADVAAHTARS